MDSENFFADDELRKFFKEASKTIYDWLPIDKKNKLSQEIASEGLLDIRDMEDEDRFFRLLNFLEMNYVKIGQWMEETLKHVSELSNLSKEKKVTDVEIQFSEEKVGLSTMSAEFSQSEIESLFRSTLKNLGLVENYKKYTEKRLEMPKYEYSE